MMRSSRKRKEQTSKPLSPGSGRRGDAAGWSRRDILGGAAALRLGATLSTPADGRTMGEALLHSLADWTKIIIALVIPLLIGAAILEIYVTPQVALMLLGK